MVHSAMRFERYAQQAMSGLCHSLVVDSTRENVAMMSLSSCLWPAVRGVVYTIIRSIGSEHAHCTSWQLAVAHAHYPMVVTSNILVLYIGHIPYTVNSIDLHVLAIL